MILAILFAGVLAGMDNLQVCSTLGLLPMQRGRRHRLALAFSFCETAAPVIGIVVGRAALAAAGPYARIAAPAMTIACAGAVLISAFRGERKSDGLPLFGLPVAMSLDNLAAGLGISPLAYPVWGAALTIGLVSAAMSCAGIYGAAALRPWIARWIPARAEYAVGGYLCLLAVRMLWVG
jgi:manganese efflux pump family protein